LWVWKREIFVEFMLAFLVLALAGFATYVLYPAAPPWIAADWHYLPHVSRIFNAGVGFFGGAQSFSSLYQWMWSHNGWDVFGAMPSEHAAFPFLCFLFARKAWPRAGWLLLPYCAAVWVAVVYLGEHYAADVIVGLMYAAVVYSLVQLAASRKWITRTETRRATIEQIPDQISDSVPA
jgi:membrane-associated phospholipid phosphatase